MTGQPKILVVDDDPDFLDFTRTTLESSSYRVAVAPDEQQGLAQIDRERPDLLILDVMMSKLSSGFQFMWKLKSDQRYQAIPILIVTSVDEKVRMDFARHANSAYRSVDDEAYLPVDGYILKPVRAAELLRAVKRILQGAKKPAAATK